MPIDNLLSRVETQTEWAKANGPRYTTTYRYDTFGNLMSVLDPAGGLTTMTYDVGNRLISRSLPNGIVTTFTYDDLDRTTSITHKRGNTVLASVTYERIGMGEPSKITREDGSYVTLSYDASLRLTEEKYHSPAGVLTETISYSYNAAGQRTAKVDRFGTDTYRYKPGYQLDSITGTGNEDYGYDADGRLNLIQRNGTTLDLDHDTYNRIASINNSNGEQTTYLYDAQGRRIGEQVGNQQRKYLVTPIMGGGLDSQDLISDGAGNVLSNFVYAGGTTPFMRLDANGNPVYYLTDALGSVIGLADGSGSSIADFRYDGFGNLRNTSGSGASNPAMGGDFRFQGQWLESESGLYYFRARDYDAQTGLFLQRDPIDIIENEPESFNPYQFVYNNPYVYIDPTGMFTLSDLNTTISIQNILNGAQRYAVNSVKDYLVDKAKGFLGEAFKLAINSVLPSHWAGIASAFREGNPLKGGESWQKALEAVFCPIFKEAGILNYVWLEPRLEVSSGRALSEGFNCRTDGSAPAFRDDGMRPRPGTTARPDYIISAYSPLDNRPGHKDLITGDIKYSGKRLYDEYIKNVDGKRSQWQAIYKHAQVQSGFQFVPVTLFITMNPTPLLEEKELESEAIIRGVVMYIFSLRDR